MNSNNIKRLLTSRFRYINIFSKKPYTLDELMYSKRYNNKRRSIPYNEQYEPHDFKVKENVSKLVLPEWSLFIHK